MSEQLADEGWLAPARPGPSRRQVAACAVLALLLLGGWYWTSVHEPEVGSDDSLPTTTIELNEVGRVALVEARRDLEPEVRTAKGVPYLVVRTSVDAAREGAHRIEVRLPAGVDPDRVTLRVAGSLDDVRTTAVDPNVVRASLELHAPDDDLDVLVTAPAELFLLPTTLLEPVGDLGDLTRPFDRRVRQDADQLRTLDRLRDASPWLLPLLAFASVAVPLLLWHRARRRFFSMRRPGPGTKLDPAPPSSLDPVGAAVLVAGAGQVDADGAFAGHVLDLVERRQLLMRRTMDVDPGAGALVGLGHADDVTDDAAIDALRAIAHDDGLTAALPDSPARRRRVPEDERDAWHLHVAARARFEGMVDHFDRRRLMLASTLLNLAGLAAAIAYVTTELAGRRALLALVVAALFPAVVVLILWVRDAGRWRIVTRARRTERAQWLAWRAAIGTPDGPPLDQRSLPVVAATGPEVPGLRSFAGPDAVALDAVTGKTVATLRAVVADDPQP